METFYGAIIAAIIGSALIVINEWTKIISEQRKQKKKFNIWNVLKQTGATPPSLTVAEISKETKLCAEQLESLLYEMVQEGTIREGPFPGTFTRYRTDYS